MTIEELKQPNSRQVFEFFPCISPENVEKAASVESITAYVDPNAPEILHAYIGTSSGSVFRFELSKTGLDLKLCSRFVEERSKVESLCLVACLKTLIVLISGQLRFLDWQGMEPRQLLIPFPTKGITVVTKKNESVSQRSPPASMVAVATSKKLAVLDLSHDESIVEAPATLQIKIFHEWSFPGIQQIAWLDDSLLIATRSQYALISLEQKTVIPLFSLPDTPQCSPLIKCFPQTHEALLLAEKAGVLVNKDGHPTGGSLVFRSIPISMGFLGSKVVAIDKAGQLDVFERSSGACLQSVRVPGALPHVNFFLANDEQSSTLLLSVSSQVYLLIERPILNQVKDLLKSRLYAEGISLAATEVPGESSSDKEERVAIAKAQAGLLQLWDLRFGQAFSNLQESEVFQPLELLRLIPEFSWRWKSMVPRKRYLGLHPPLQSLTEIIRAGLKLVKAGQLDTPALTQGHHLMSPEDPVESRLFTEAVYCLTRYFHAVRRRGFSAAEMEAIDTVLVQLYLQLDCQEEVEELAREDARCLLANVEAGLRDKQWFSALALILESRGMKERAISVWADVARAGGNQEGNVAEPGTSSVAEAVKQVARILSEVEDGRLAVKHALWMLDVDADVAILVLMSPHVEPDVVLSALPAKHLGARLRYLQWLIEEQNSPVRDHHTVYALTMAQQVLEEREGMSASSPLRLKLQQFLKESMVYDVEDVLHHIHGSDLWNEQVLLHFRLGDHISALRILALELKEFKSAERYCSSLDDPSVYQTLLDIYLHPGKGAPPLHLPAVQLLSSFGAKSLNAVQVVESFPADMGLEEVWQSLASLLNIEEHKARKNEIMLRLLREVRLSMKEQRVNLRGRHVIIADDTRCSVCGLKIGTKLFGCYPSGEVACYQCLKLS